MISPEIKFVIREKSLETTEQKERIKEERTTTGPILRATDRRAPQSIPYKKGHSLLPVKRSRGRVSLYIKSISYKKKQWRPPSSKPLYIYQMNAVYLWMGLAKYRYGNTITKTG
jgi:hypothetical protein